MRQRSTQVVVVPPFGRVVRYRTDAVGNDLTAVLHWCETHHEPVWLYGDGSFECPHTRLVGYDTEDHVVVTGPWETNEEPRDHARRDWR